jgi:CRP-like cAMP-binding protein
VKLLNFLLSALTPADYAALAPGLVEITLTPGQVLFEPDDPVGVVYFPGSACLSVVTLMESGKAVETATVGRETALGLMDVITGMPTRSRSFAQVGGGAMRLSACLYRARMRESRALTDLTWLHARATALQAEQGVACNVSHDVLERLARWLLMTQDRVGANTFPLTQDYMAVMTGVQRTTVSVVAGALKRAGTIDYARGRVTVIDRDALLRSACECYAIMDAEFKSLGEPTSD